jgi:hypothetical protein
LLTCEVVVGPAQYVWVAVSARLRLDPRAVRHDVVARANEALYRYIHPTLGGPAGNGWPFQRPLFVAEVYSLLQRLDGVDTVEEAHLQQVDPVRGEMTERADRITPGADGLLCSFEHSIEVM